MRMFIHRGYKTIEEAIVGNAHCEPEQLDGSLESYIYHLDEVATYLLQYLKEHENPTITIVGDYDSDGINSTSILLWAFKALGVTPTYRIPHRMSEGYGLNVSIIDEIEEGLLITVDNGIVAFDAIRKAKEKGLSVIIIDHHLPVKDEKGEVQIPCADLWIDPAAEVESDFHDYCGAHLAYRLAKRLLPNAKLKTLCVLAGLATVTDMMLMQGPNHTLVKESLQYINEGIAVPGLKTLLAHLNLAEHITETDFGFGIGPVYNAMGRLYDDGADYGVELNLSKKGEAKMEQLADLMIRTNDRRKEIVAQAKKELIISSEDNEALVVYKAYPEGIVGLIAGALANTYHRPAIVFTDSLEEGILKGSGRSIEGVHLKNVLDELNKKGLVYKYGGHAEAAGISIRRNQLHAFTEAFKKACGELPESDEKTLFDLELGELSEEKIESAYQKERIYAPYGEGHPKPLYHGVLHSNGFFFMGKDEDHIRATAKNVKFVGFGLGERYKALQNPKDIEIVGTISESWFRGERSLQFEIQDFLPIR